MTSTSPHSSRNREMTASLQLKGSLPLGLLVGIIISSLVLAVTAPRASAGDDLPAMSPAFGQEGPMFLEQDGGTAEWYHTSGTQTITRDGNTLTRRVDVWAALDGRYRVKTTSLDGSGDSEEIAYDGHGHQLAVIASQGEVQQAFVVENSKHFAISRTMGSRLYSNSQYSGLLVKGSTNAGTLGSAQYMAGQTSKHHGSSSILTIAIPKGIEVLEEAALTQTIRNDDHSTLDLAMSSSTQASRRETMFDLHSRPCLEARNFRNSVTNYFRATSLNIADQSMDGTCRFLRLSIWRNGWLNGWCGIAHKHTVRPDRRNYVWWTGYFEVAGKPGVDDVACSRHLAFDNYWTLQISLGHLPAGVRG